MTLKPTRCVVSALVVVLAYQSATAGQPLPPSARRMVAAFRAMESEPTRAVALASRVIDDHWQDALELQRLIAAKVAKGEPPPPIGKVTKEQFIKTCATGLLNDVAACLWIKGVALCRLGSHERAIQAFAQCTQLSHGRVWDPVDNPKGGYSPNGHFWSPAKDAQSRIRKCREHLSRAPKSNSAR